MVRFAAKFTPDPAIIASPDPHSSWGILPDNKIRSQGEPRNDKIT